VSAFNFGAIEDGVARVCADAIGGRVYAAGLTASVIGAAPQVVPLDRNFTELGMPAVTCVIGDGQQLLQPGNVRLHITILGVVWREGVELGDAKNALLGDLAALIDVFAAHTKGYLTDAAIQSAVLTKWSRPTPRALGDAASGERQFLTLPFEIEAVASRQILMHPA
jgi:hypothetical protein